MSRITPTLARVPARMACALALTTCALALALTAARAAADPTLAAPTVVAGPSSAISALGGLSIARDGTGGLVFTAAVGGAPHVFVSRLLGGQFGPPTQVDGLLPAPSSQPVIAAGSGGLLLVAFVNAGVLYAAGTASGGAPLGMSASLFAGAANPAISITPGGKAYVAFTAVGAGGHDVRSAYYSAGRWALEPTPLDAAAGDDAGVGAGPPAVAAAGDGVAIVAWGESGHIYSRRVWGTAPSAAYQQADPPTIGSWGEVAAAEPSVGSGGDSSYADVAFRETVASASATQTRVLMSRLVAGRYAAAVPADALGTPAGDGAGDPQVLSGEYGRGFVLSSHNGSHQLFALNLLGNGAPGATQGLDSAPNLADPFAAGGTAGLFSSLIAWQVTPALGPPEIHLRFGTDGGDLGPEQIASDPALGPAEAAAGLAAGGDVAGDAAAAWVQGTGPDTRIVAAQLYQPPGGFSVSARNSYANTSQPQFSWSAAHASWGPVVYRLVVDGMLAGQTTTTSLRPAASLGDGPHSWQVTAINPVGLMSVTAPATVNVDTLAPLVVATLSGRRVAGARLRLRVAITDLRPGEPPSGSSGIAGRTVGWGDGTVSAVGSATGHVYARPGLYRLTVTAADRAGNVTRVTRYLRIRPVPVRHRARHRRKR